MTIPLGKREYVELRSIRAMEATDFTPWLAETLTPSGETLGHLPWRVPIARPTIKPSPPPITPPITAPAAIPKGPPGAPMAAPAVIPATNAPPTAPATANPNPVISIAFRWFRVTSRPKNRTSWYRFSISSRERLTGSSGGPEGGGVSAGTVTHGLASPVACRDAASASVAISLLGSGGFRASSPTPPSSCAAADTSGAGVSVVGGACCAAPAPFAADAVPRPSAAPASVCVLLAAFANSRNGRLTASSKYFGQRYVRPAPR